MRISNITIRPNRKQADHPTSNSSSTLILSASLWQQTNTIEIKNNIQRNQNDRSGYNNKSTNLPNEISNPIKHAIKDHNKYGTNNCIILLVQALPCLHLPCKQNTTYSHKCRHIEGINKIPKMIFLTIL